MARQSEWTLCFVGLFAAVVRVAVGDLAYDGTSFIHRQFVKIAKEIKIERQTARSWLY